jgi:tetratricopeptide (TPR) repeat protein
MPRCAAFLLVATLAIASASAGVIPPSSEERAERMARWRTDLAEAEAASRAGESARAEALYRGVIEAAAAAGDDGLLVARAVDGLADLCSAQGRLDEARELYARSSAQWERLLGARQPRLAVTLHNLALVEAARGERDDARRHLRRAIEIFEGSLGPDSEQARASRASYAALGEPDTATR